VRDAMQKDRERERERKRERQRENKERKGIQAMYTEMFH
jgi:hypothetical protein